MCGHFSFHWFFLVGEGGCFFFAFSSFLAYLLLWFCWPLPSSCVKKVLLECHIGKDVFVREILKVNSLAKFVQSTHLGMLNDSIIIIIIITSHYAGNEPAPWTWVSGRNQT